MKLRIGRKGLGFEDMVRYGLLFVLIGIILGIGAYVNSQVQTTAGWATSTTEYQAVANATIGIGTLSSWLPIIAVIIAAAIIIGLLVRAFAVGGV